MIEELEQERSEQEELTATEEGLEQQDVSLDSAEEEQPVSSEVEATQAEIEKLRARIRELEADNRGKSQAITRLSKSRAELEADMVAKIDYLNKKLDLLMKQQVGEGTFTEVPLEQQLAKLDTEYSQKRQAIEAATLYQKHAEESLAAVKEILEAAGYSLESQEPEVEEIRSQWNDAIAKGERLDGVIARAARIVKKKVPDQQSLKEQIRREVLEEFKRSGKLKVETSPPSGEMRDFRQIEKLYAEGEITTEQYKEALRKYGKL